MKKLSIVLGVILLLVVALVLFGERIGFDPKAYLPGNNDNWCGYTAPACDGECDDGGECKYNNEFNECYCDNSAQSESSESAASDSTSSPRGCGESVPECNGTCGQGQVCVTST